MEKFWDAIPNFKKSDFECRCGCGMNIISESFMIKLQSARTYSGVKYIINSGCRCNKHNAKVGGSPNSSHLKGIAADIQIDNNKTRYKIIRGLLSAGFKRVGIGKSFIHVDCDERKADEVIWLY